MVKSGYQPTSTASARGSGRPPGAPASRPASRSGPVRPSSPRTSTRRCPRRVSTAPRCWPGVSTASSGRSKPMDRSVCAYCLRRLGGAVGEHHERQPLPCRPAGDLQRAGQRRQPVVVPVAEHQRPVQVEDEAADRRAAAVIGVGRSGSRGRAARSGRGGVVRHCALPIGSPPRSSRRKPGLSTTTPDTAGRAREAGQQLEHRLEVGVVVPPGRAGGEHRVDLVRRASSRGAGIPRR